MRSKSRSRSKSPTALPYQIPPTYRWALIRRMNIAEMKAFAKKHKIPLGKAATKSEIGQKIADSKLVDTMEIRGASRQARKKESRSSRSKSPSRKKKTTKRSASTCPKSRMVHRKAYTRADGTKVKAVSYCRKK